MQDYTTTLYLHETIQRIILHVQNNLEANIIQKNKQIRQTTINKLEYPIPHATKNAFQNKPVHFWLKVSGWTTFPYTQTDCTPIHANDVNVKQCRNIDVK